MPTASTHESIFNNRGAVGPPSPPPLAGSRSDKRLRCRAEMLCTIGPGAGRSPPAQAQNRRSLPP